MSPARACIIGATGGIGQVVAAHLWQAGYALVLCGRSLGTLSQLAAALARRPTRTPQSCFTIAMDVQDAVGVQALGEQCHTLDLLVFCHGAAPAIGPTETLTPAQCADVWDVDVQGTVRVVQAALPALRAAAPSSIVIVGSIHAFGAYPQRAPYAAAKAGLLGLTRAWAVEFGPLGIRCNYIAPGQVEGPRTRALIPPADWARMLARSPTGEIVDAADIGRCVVFLAQCRSINGQAVVLDHAWSASYWWGTHGNAAGDAGNDC